MKQNKQTYLSPVTETLVVQSEGYIMTLSNTVFNTIYGTEEMEDGGEENF